ncbi:MAG TPA: hypothetical protein VE262_05750 [Blastocatellia bacterium]|nr:hypothetical protein [Blastocatellia bacterium]
MADIDRDDDRDDTQCAHEICTCSKADDSAYCSVYCETAGDTVELACDCGHPGCATELST